MDHSKSAFHDDNVSISKKMSFSSEESLSIYAGIYPTKQLKLREQWYILSSSWFNRWQLFIESHRGDNSNGNIGNL